MRLAFCTLPRGPARPRLERFRELVLTKMPPAAVYGLIRSDVLRQTSLHKSFTGSDNNLCAALALRGPFYMMPEPLFFNRRHERNVYKDSRGRMAWGRPDLAISGRPTLPYWLRLAEYVRVVMDAPLSLRERASCGVMLLRWVGMRWRSLGWDLGLMALMLVHSKEWRVARYAPEHWKY